MKDTRKYVKSRQLHKEGYSQESKVDLDGNGKVQSVSLTSDRKQNGENAYDSMLLERILDRDNLNRAFKRVKKNKGSHGVDKLIIDELLKYLQTYGANLRQFILDGIYIPKPVRRVEIPKDNGKIRKLGIPTVVDRVIQQAISQILSPIFEMTFLNIATDFVLIRDVMML
ncbi:hypothetical protein [Anaeromicrobium sp.]|uniref:hypothetical protein n=1 Tax=Anaeromicrobium sp. TaxID=1929132 RepID=UPI002ED57CEE